MDANRTSGLKGRVIRAAECALKVTGYVSPIELFTQMGFLAPAAVRMWEKGGQGAGVRSRH
jgi:hypothetical protein